MRQYHASQVAHRGGAEGVLALPNDPGASRIKVQMTDLGGNYPTEVFDGPTPDIKPANIVTREFFAEVNRPVRAVLDLGMTGLRGVARRDKLGGESGRGGDCHPLIGQVSHQQRR